VADQVHHNRKAARYPDLFFEPENLMSVDRTCHEVLERESE
jgi:hypothetical protein